MIEDLDIMLQIALTYKENNLDKILMQTEHLIYLLSRLIECQNMINKKPESDNE